MDLTTPVDHADAYTWAAVALAHLAIGLVLTGALAAVLSRLLPGAPGMGRGNASWIQRGCRQQLD